MSMQDSTTERYALIGQPMTGQGRFCAKAMIRFEDTTERDWLKANGYRWNGTQECWNKPGTIEDCTVALGLLIERGYSVPNPNIARGLLAQTMTALRSLGLEPKETFVYPNPLFS